MRALFIMYGFDYFRGTLSIFLYPEVSAEDETTLLTDIMEVGRQVLNNDANVLLLSGLQHREAMRKQYVESDVG